MKKNKYEIISVNENQEITHRYNFENYYAVKNENILSKSIDKIINYHAKILKTNPDISKLITKVEE